MSDVLRVSRALASIDETINTINDLYETVSEITDENKRLRKLVKGAYYEGWHTGAKLKQEIRKDWKNSQARAAIREGGKDG